MKKQLKSLLINSALLAGTFSLGISGLGINSLPVFADDIQTEPAVTTVSTEYRDDDDYIITGTRVEPDFSEHHYTVADAEKYLYTEVYNSFSITKNPDDVIAYDGDKVYFTVKATGSDLSYQWQYKRQESQTWSDVYGKTLPTMEREVSKYFDGNSYRCVVKSGTETLYSSPALLTVYSAPEIVQQPEGLTVDEGKNFILSVKASGHDLKYQWQWRKSSSTRWNDASGDTSSTLIRTNVTTGYNGNYYRCIVTSGPNKVTSNAVQVNVNPAPTITQQPQNVHVTAGSAINLSVKATGKNLKYQWQYKISPTGTWYSTSDGSVSSITRTGYQSYNGYYYRCIVTSGSNSVTSNAASVTVDSTISITQQPKNVYVNERDDFSLYVKATGTNLRYQWQYSDNYGAWKDCTEATTDTLERRAYLGYAKYRYRCIVKNDSYTAYSSIVSLNISDFRITSQPKNFTVDEDHDFYLYIETNRKTVSYNWQYNNGSGWTDCTSGKVQKLERSAVMGYKGYKYRCIVTSGNETLYSDTAAITIIPVRITQHPRSLTVMPCTNYELSVETSATTPVTYQWQYFPKGGSIWVDCTKATDKVLKRTAVKGYDGYKYRCLVHTSGNTIVSNEASLSIVPLKITTQPKSVTVPENDSFHLTVKTNLDNTKLASSYYLKYQWQYKKGTDGTWKDCTDATTDTLSRCAYSGYKDYSYRCIVYIDNFKVTSDVASLTIVPKLKITSHSGSKTVYSGTTVSFSVTPNLSGVSYQWQYSTNGGTAWKLCTLGDYKKQTLTFKATKEMSGYKFRCCVIGYSQTVFTGYEDMVLTVK